jgi:hypothetical protein
LRYRAAQQSSSAGLVALVAVGVVAFIGARLAQQPARAPDGVSVVQATAKIAFRLGF